MTENKEELKSLLMKVKEECEKAGLNLNILRVKLMASSAISSWQIKDENVNSLTDFFSWPPKSLGKITVAMKLKDICSLTGKL